MKVAEKPRAMKPALLITWPSTLVWLDTLGYQFLLLDDVLRPVQLTIELEDICNSG